MQGIFHYWTLHELLKREENELGSGDIKRRIQHNGISFCITLSSSSGQLRYEYSLKVRENRGGENVMKHKRTQGIGSVCGHTSPSWRIELRSVVVKSSPTMNTDNGCREKPLRIRLGLFSMKITTRV